MHLLDAEGAGDLRLVFSAGQMAPPLRRDFRQDAMLPRKNTTCTCITLAPDASAGECKWCVSRRPCAISYQKYSAPRTAQGAIEEARSKLEAC